MNEDEKTIKIKLKKRHVEWIKKNYGKSKMGVTSLFEYGGIDIQEVHAIADLLYHLNEAFNIEDGG
tara:strand:+ start:107 stop:304 length:198 start_codon:yes stop_codon:yes gene_type:complete